MHSMVPLGDELKWKLVLVRLETVLVSVQDRCIACAKHTIGSKIVLDAQVTRLKWVLILVRLEIVLIWTQDRRAVCAEHAIGSKIIFDAPDGTPR
jgi:hypothetical protein